MPVKTSIIIVNFQADQHVRRLKKSLEAVEDAEIIVVDNSDGKRGYGEGCNLGARKAKGKYFLFLNPDIEMKPTDVQIMVHILEKMPLVGVVGPQILRPNGAIEISCADFPTPLLALIEYSFLKKIPVLKDISRRYRLFGFDHKSSRPVPLVGGSALLVRRRDFEALGGFDEKLFLYFEEFDLAYRMRQQFGKTAYFCSEAKITHYGQASTRQVHNVSRHFYQSRRYWFHKAFGWQGMLVARLLEFMENRHG